MSRSLAIPIALRPADIARQLITVLLLTMALLAANASAEIAYSAASAAEGAQTFLQYCTECHGKDGRAQMDIISDATDLTEPDAYYNGTSRADIYTSITDGAGVGMPPFSYHLKNEDDLWHLVNFVRSLWTDEQRASN